MDNLSTIPTVGWIVILITIILIFVLAWFKGISIKKDGEISIEKKLTEYDDKKIHDENLRLEITQKIEEIDKTEKSEEKRLIKNIKIKIRLIIRIQANCEIAFRSIVDILTDVFSNRVIENNLRIHLQKEERETYLNDILNELRDNYVDFTGDLDDAYCRRNDTTVNYYPDFSDLENDFKDLLNYWCNENVKIIINSCKKKIKTYEENADGFCNKKYKETAINKPIEKNENYVKALL